MSIVWWMCVCVHVLVYVCFRRLSAGERMGAHVSMVYVLVLLLFVGACSCFFSVLVCTRSLSPKNHLE